jgi:hypothetical protein
MELKIAKIIFNDSPSKFNKELITYIDSNLDSAIRKGRLNFQYEIAAPSKLSELRDLGINILPAMIVEESTFSGVASIIKEIRKRINSAKTLVASKTDDEIIREFQENALGDYQVDSNGKVKFLDDADDEKDESASLMNKYSNEMKKRNSSSNNSNNNNNNNNEQIKNANIKPSRNQIDSEVDDYKISNYSKPNNISSYNNDNDEPSDMQDDLLLEQLMEKINGEDC